MKKCYILAHNAAAASHEQMSTVLNSLKEVSIWKSEIPSVFFIVSENSAAELTKLVRAQTGDKGRFLISEITANRNGWITADSWHLINNKTFKTPG
jgi:hypothetical protein